MIEVIITILLYFIIGVAQSIIGTLWIMSLESRKVFLSGFISLLLTLMSFGVLAYMILSPDFLPRLIVYALGTGTGTSLTVYLRDNGNDRYISGFVYRLFKRTSG